MITLKDVEKLKKLVAERDGMAAKVEKCRKVVERAQAELKAVLTKQASIQAEIKKLCGGKKAVKSAKPAKPHAQPAPAAHAAPVAAPTHPTAKKAHPVGKAAPAATAGKKGDTGADDGSIVKGTI